MSTKIHRVKRTRSSEGEETKSLQTLQAKLIALQEENRELSKQLQAAEKEIRALEADIGLDPDDSYFADDDDDEDGDEDE